jgi:hypothetical protein
VKDSGEAEWLDALADGEQARSLHEGLVKRA